ncbi:MAG: hypothetical protein PQJ45_08055 [Sphaerochaetaceae bacterium]|nr:hypothetical protein [Sphaerochaetaceae bacterium]
MFLLQYFLYKDRLVFLVFFESSQLSVISAITRRASSPIILIELNVFSSLQTMIASLSFVEK